MKPWIQVPVTQQKPKAGICMTIINKLCARDLIFLKTFYGQVDACQSEQLRKQRKDDYGMLKDRLSLGVWERPCLRKPRAGNIAQWQSVCLVWVPSPPPTNISIIRLEGYIQCLLHCWLGGIWLQAAEIMFSYYCYEQLATNICLRTSRQARTFFWWTHPRQSKTEHS